MKTQAAIGLEGGERWIFGHRQQLDDELLTLLSRSLWIGSLWKPVWSPLGRAARACGMASQFCNPSAAFDCAHSIPGDSAFAHSGALSGKINVSFSAGDCRQRNRLDLRAATIYRFLHLISNGLRKNPF